MDPNNQGSEEYGHDADGSTPRQRPPRDALASDFGQHTPALARTVQLVSGDYLLTVNPVDGSEIEVCPPGERPGRPVKLTAAERAEITRAAKPHVPPGPTRPELPLLERDGERERLVRLLARGRSVRLTGPAGSGRTTLLDAVAADCADLAPDGVVRLTGFHRTQTDLLYDLFYAVYSAPLYRPEPDELRALVREAGAVVVLDDVEFGGAALDELLDATPECAFLISAAPDVPAPSADSMIEELFLDGLDRAGGLELLERSVGRVLTEEEANWAGDLWFESEGLPLRFVQAGALLRQRDGLRARTDAVDAFGVFGDIPADAPPSDTDTGVEDDVVPLPSLAEGAAPAPLLASRLSASARDTLRFAVALGGEVPHQAHLPALVGDTHADAALGELLGCALVSPVGSHYRLAAGVRTQLEAAGYGEDAQDQALTAAQHYAWWAGHPSVTPERVCAESDALLAALVALGGPVPATTPPADDEESTAVRLASTAAPAFAAGLYWSAWERVLLAGAEAARLSGEVSEQAYFQHELGILALCGDQLDLARTELEAAIGLRGALADKRGMVAGRRALTLVADRAGDTPGLGSGPLSTAGEEVPDARYEESASPPGGVPAVFGAAGHTPPQPSPAGSASASGYGAGEFPATLISSRSGGGAHKVSGIQRLVGGARRNLVAVGAGALLAAVLGTVVTLGATSNPGDAPSDRVGVNPSASAGGDDDSLGADKADDGSAGNDSNGDTGTATSRPTDPGPDGTMGTSDDPTPPPTDGDEPSDEPTGTKTPGGGSGGTGGSSGSASPKPSPTPTKASPSETPPSETPGTPTPSVSSSPTPSGGPSESPPTPTTTPDSSVTASGPASSSPVQTASEPVSAPVDTDTPTPVI
ncbi:MAG: ATP-binding protein [Streptomyces turgidiscabies]|nr:ATP-binding protein [Streptomyces turgidiscabies]